MKKIILTLLLALMLCAGAMAENAVRVDYTLFGSDSFHPELPPEEDYFLTYEGERYSLLDAYAEFKQAVNVWGGKSQSVYEMTLPPDSFSVEDDGNALLIGDLVIDVPYRAELTVLEGNRRSGEYVILDQRALTDVYQDSIILPRGADGRPLLIDRIYLYTFDVGGEPRRQATTLFIDYDGYAAGYASGAIEPARTAAPAATKLPEASEQRESRSSSATVAVTVAALMCVMVNILRGKRKPAAKQPEARLVKPEEQPVSPADASLAQGQELLRQIQAESLRIPDPDVAARADALREICGQMLAAVADQPGKAPQLRRFLSYYLPTSLKLLSFLRTVRQRGVSAAEVDKVRESTLCGLDMVLAACQKQLDNLFRDEMLDSSADIQVLEQMLQRDGLLQSDLDKLRAGK